MAHIKKMLDKPRKLLWRVQIRRKGHKTIVRFLETRKEADAFASEHERAIRLTGLPLTIEELKKQTVGDLVRRYLGEITPKKGCRVSEKTVLTKFLRHELCSKSLAYVSRQDAYKYINGRLDEVYKGKPIKPSTVRREINSIQHIFAVAKDQWGLTNLQNPFAGVEIKGSSHRRRRRLQAGEYDRLLGACNGCRGLNKFYVPLAIIFAIETGLRTQEIFNLTWNDIDFDKRQIDIRKSKTDHVTEYEGRTVVLTVLATFYLVKLGLTLAQTRSMSKSDRIFPITKSAFKQSWQDIVKRARIESLQFRDLRREAGSRFDEAGLTKAEHDLMMGHSNHDMHSLYISSHLKSIRDKLDKHKFGRTAAEIMADDTVDKDVSPAQREVNEKYKAAFKTFDYHLLADLVPMLKAKAKSALHARK